MSKLPNPGSANTHSYMPTLFCESGKAPSQLFPWERVTGYPAFRMAGTRGSSCEADRFQPTAAARAEKSSTTIVVAGFSRSFLTSKFTFVEFDHPPEEVVTRKPI